MKIGLLLAVFCSAVLLSCPTEAPSGGDYGSLVLEISSSQMAAKTIVPPFDMNPASYDVTGNGPDSSTFSQTGVTTDSLVQHSLLVGAWMITVDAFNAAHDWIGTGSTAVVVEAGEAAETSVQVAPLMGNGTLAIEISWLPGLIASPAIAGTLTPIGGSSEELTFMVEENSARNVSGGVLNVGYYALALQLLDGGAVTWGFFEAVRIIKDETTAVDFSLTAQDINTGGLSLAITPAMQSPIAVSFSGQQALLAAGSAMTIAATTSSDPADTSQWYLNGGPLSGQTSPSITIGSTLPAGNYRLDLGVTKGNIIGSGSISFSIINPPSEIIQTNVAETGTDLDIYFYRGPEFTGHPLYSIWVEDTNGTFLQDLFVCNAPGTNVYPYSAEWIARPMSVPYWAHKACIEDPYAGHPSRNSAGMYLALPTVDGGPVPADLDAVTGATREADFVLRTSRKNDGVSQVRVLLEINRSWDYNAYYDSSYDPGGQPSLVYGATVQTGSGERAYTMSLLGTGHPLGTDGALYGTSNLTTALEILKKVIVHVKE